jgi:hypothetical protein
MQVVAELQHAPPDAGFDGAQWLAQGFGNFNMR